MLLALGRIMIAGRKGGADLAAKTMGESAWRVILATFNRLAEAWS